MQQPIAVGLLFVEQLVNQCRTEQSEQRVAKAHGGNTWTVYFMTHIEVTRVEACELYLIHDFLYSICCLFSFRTYLIQCFSDLIST